MDYSLLLGIDVERKQIACGLVDTIGELTMDVDRRIVSKLNRELHFRQDLGV